MNVFAPATCVIVCASLLGFTGVAGAADDANDPPPEIARDIVATYQGSLNRLGWRYLSFVCPDGQFYSGADSHYGKGTSKWIVVTRPQGSRRSSGIVAVASWSLTRERYDIRIRCHASPA